MSRDSVVDALGLPRNIRVTCADNHTGMVGTCEVQTHEIAPIECQLHPDVLNRLRQDQGIIGTSIGQASLMSRHNIVAQLTKLIDDAAA